MSREIKFRAWSKRENLMGEVTGFRFSKSQYPFVKVRFRKNGKIVDEGYHFGQEDGCDSVILMQYTGLKDKNGVEIYEGDILACGDGRVPTLIFWDTENNCWSARNLPRQEKHRLNRHFKRFMGEVIGNIYNNHEMLEVSEESET